MIEDTYVLNDGSSPTHSERDSRRTDRPGSVGATARVLASSAGAQRNDSRGFARDGTVRDCAQNRRGGVCEDPTRLPCRAVSRGSMAISGQSLGLGTKIVDGVLIVSKPHESRMQVLWSKV